LKNWDDEFANAIYIEGATDYITSWENESRAFREEVAINNKAMLNVPYGDKTRNKYDLFLPKDKPKGLMFFVHGGYWLDFDKSYWSHLAKGGLESGYAVAIISYTLCPGTNIPQIIDETTIALDVVAGEIDGPIYLAGHSAGGFLVSRLICTDSHLSISTKQKIERCVSISGVYDLRPLMHTKMNKELNIDFETAQSHSPVLLSPRKGIEHVCWVGENERPEFLRQSQLLKDMWLGFDISHKVYIDKNKHHFNVIDGLRNAESPLCKLLFASRM